MNNDTSDTGTPAAQPPGTVELTTYPYEYIRSAAMTLWNGGGSNPEVYRRILDLMAFKLTILRLCKEQKKLLTNEQNSHSALAVQRYIDWGYEEQVQKRGEHMGDLMMKALQDSCKDAVKLFEELPTMETDVGNEPNGRV